MDLDRIRELLQVVAQSDVSEVEIHDGDLKVVVRKNAPSVTVQPPAQAFPFAFPPMAYPGAWPAPQAGPGHAPVQSASIPAAPAAQSPAPAESAAVRVTPGKEVRAPIVGTFYRSPSPDADAYVSVGDRVKPGDVLCIIEAMKLMNEVECEMSGIVREILVDNAQPVEFDQPLFVIEPA